MKKPAKVQPKSATPLLTTDVYVPEINVPEINGKKRPRVNSFDFAKAIHAPVFIPALPRLQQAVRDNDLKTIADLIQNEHRHSLNRQDVHGDTAINIAAKKAMDTAFNDDTTLEILKVLFDAGADFTIPNHRKEIPADFLSLAPDDNKIVNRIFHEQGKRYHAIKSH